MTTGGGQVDATVTWATDYHPVGGVTLSVVTVEGSGKRNVYEDPNQLLG